MPRRPRRLRGAAERMCAARARCAPRALVGNHDLVVLGKLDVERVLAQRGDRGALDREELSAEARTSSPARAERRRRRRSASSTPAHAIRSGSTCSRRARERLHGRDGSRIGAVGHSHVALHFCAPATARRGAGEQAPAEDRAGPLRAASGSSTPAPSASPATATPGRLGCCSTWRRWTRHLAAGRVSDRRRRAAIEACRPPRVLADRLYYGQ